MPTWNDLFKKDENRWKGIYPPVAEFLSEFGIQKDSLILDLGCGAGRHLKYLVENGYTCTGMDLSENGLTASQECCRQMGRNPILTRADMTALPYSDQEFGVVISVHVIFHNPRQLVKATLSEIYRVLKSGGFALLTFNSTYSGRCGHGIKIEDGTYVPDIGHDRGIPHHFSDLVDLADLMTGFKVQQITLHETMDDDYLSSHWNVIVKKEA